MNAADLIADLYDVFERRSLARLLGVNDSTLYRWSKEQATPNPRYLHALERLHELLPEIRAAAKSSNRAERLIV